MIYLISNLKMPIKIIKKIQNGQNKIRMTLKSLINNIKSIKQIINLLKRKNEKTKKEKIKVRKKIKIQIKIFLRKNKWQTPRKVPQK